MRIGKGVLTLVAIAFLVGGTADAQVQANRITIQNGGEYYDAGPYMGFPNHGGCKYFPSFAHIPSAPFGTAPYTYPWKIAGWIWTGMQANVYGPQWFRTTCLQALPDMPHSPFMSFDYPQLYATGAVPPTCFPSPMNFGALPTIVPVVGGRNTMWPDSPGGVYLGIFAVGAASWNIPSTAPYYGWEFAFALPCASAITVPSTTSIWEYVYKSDGPNPQYLINSFNEQDCLGGPGNPGRNYSVISDTDNGYLWYWTNSGTGVYGGEYSMGLFVCDTVSLPMNVPGAGGPFFLFGFDVGVATLMPKNSLNCQWLGVMTEDYTNSTPSSGLKPLILLLAVNPRIPGTPPINAHGDRLPHGWDAVTNLILGLAPLFAHYTSAGYPAAIFGSTAGGHSSVLPFPADPALFSVEFFMSTYSLQTKAVSAGYMSTFF